MKHCRAAGKRATISYCIEYSELLIIEIVRAAKVSMKEGCEAGVLIVMPIPADIMF